MHEKHRIRDTFAAFATAVVFAVAPVLPVRAGSSAGPDYLPPGSPAESLGADTDDTMPATRCPPPRMVRRFRCPSDGKSGGLGRELRRWGERFMGMCTGSYKAVPQQCR